jgi:sugar phosphate isomerase/epimerase
MNRRQFIKTAAVLSSLPAAWPTFAAPASTGDSPWQIGCYTRPWDQFDYRVALDGIAEAGYHGAGLMTAKGKSWVIITPDTSVEEAARVGEEVRKRGLRTLSVYGDFSVKTAVAEGLQDLRRLIDNASACGAPSLMLGGVSEERYYQPYFQAVREACDYAASKGIVLTIKPHGGLNATGPQCRKAIGWVGKSNFRLWYDPGNIFYYSDGKLDPVDDAATVDGLVEGMSIKDFLPPKEVQVTPGTGKVNFAEVFRRLKQGGFKTGPLIVECLARADAADKITVEARKARLFVEALVKA